MIFCLTCKKKYEEPYFIFNCVFYFAKIYILLSFLVIILLSLYYNTN